MRVFTLKLDNHPLLLNKISETVTAGYAGVFC